MSLPLRLLVASILAGTCLLASAANRPQNSFSGDAEGGPILLAPAAEGAYEPSYAGFQDAVPQEEVLPADPGLEFHPPQSMQVDGPLPGSMHDHGAPCCEQDNCCEEFCCDSHDCHTECVERGFLWRLFHPRYWHVFHRHRCHRCGNDCEGDICECERSRGGCLRNLFKHCRGLLHRNRHHDHCDCMECDGMTCGTEGFSQGEWMGDGDMSMGMGMSEPSFTSADEGEVFQADQTPPTRTYRRPLDKTEVVPVPRVERKGADLTLPPAALIGPGLDVETSSDRSPRKKEDDRVVRAAPRLSVPLPLELLSVSL
jgi:hypothetical protein